MKGDIRQTDATKNAATVFGIASSFGANLRDNMREIHFIQDGTAVNRMNKETCAILRKHRDASTGDFHFQPDAFKPIEGFEMNQNSPMRENFLAMPEVSLQNGKLLVRIPEFAVNKTLKFPREADSCTIIISVYIASLKTKDECMMDGDMTETFNIDRHQQSFPSTEWSYDIPEGCFCVTSMALHFHTQHSNLQVYLNNKSFCPAMICDFSINPGEFKDKPKKWMTTNFAFEDGAHPPIKKKTKKKQNPIVIKSDQKNAKTKKIAHAKKKTSKKKSNNEVPAPCLTSQDQLLQYLEIQQQQNEALQQQVKELQVQLAELKNLVSDSKASIKPSAAQNIACTVIMQANLLNIVKPDGFPIMPTISVTTSAQRIPDKLLDSFNHKNRGKPAA
ncbi:hypothetical protein PBAL39_08050 [Pedobacter sp. BAL39]|nr:hypothetical protein PBAL39_08050 [Pedobacter sp. BAL39]